MERKIVGYHLDEHNDWVAELDCHHGQHVRHKPPFIRRPWVQTEEGRASRLGQVLNCVRCDRLELPEALETLTRTPEFTRDTVPSKLLSDHATKTGVWGLIRVLEGSLIYNVYTNVTERFRISQGEQAVIAPGISHSVELKNGARFYIELLTR